MLFPEVVYLYLQEIYKNKRIERYQVQSTGITNFKFQFFLDAEHIVVPKKQVQEAFRLVVQPILESIHALGAKNTNLRRTRDLLLPRLVSGELDVSELEIAGVDAL